MIYAHKKANHKGLITTALLTCFVGTVITFFLVVSAATVQETDLNSDGRIDISDLSILLTNYGKGAMVGDVNKDNQVDIYDLSAILSNYGKVYTPPTTGGCPSTTPNTPDGPDPWGGCWPGPSNTGVPAGTTLTTYSGSCDVYTPQTIVAKTINCVSNDFVIHAGACGTTITNSYVNGQVYTDGSGGTDKACVTVTDSTLDPGPLPSSTDGRGIGTRNFTAIRVETIRGKSGGWCEYYCLVKDSYMHGQARDATGAAHESGLRQGSGATTRAQSIVHNTLVCDAPEVPPDAGCSAPLTGYGDFDTIRNNYVYRNLFVASKSDGGGFCAYGGNSGSKPFPNSENQEFIQNVFQRGNSGFCGVYGAISGFAESVRGNVWSGNTYDDGTPVGSDD